MGRKTSAVPQASGAKYLTDTMSQTDPVNSADPPMPETADTDKIMMAIASCQSALMTKIDDLQVDITRLRSDINAIKDRTSEVERRVGAVEDDMHTTETTIHTLKQQVKVLEARAEDAENRNRRNNVRILGLPERAEGPNPELFAEQLIRELLSPITLSPCFIIERAHRIPTRALPPGAPARPFIIKVLNYRDRDAILTAARKKGTVTFENTRLSFYPDFTADVQKKRRQFTQIRSRLRDLGLKYAMIYPTKLRVQDQDRAWFFNTPEEASDWLDRRPRVANQREGTPP